MIEITLSNYTELLDRWLPNNPDWEKNRPVKYFLYFRDGLVEDIKEYAYKNRLCILTYRYLNFRIVEFKEDFTLKNYYKSCMLDPTPDLDFLKRHYAPDFENLIPPDKDIIHDVDFKGFLEGKYNSTGTGVDTPGNFCTQESKEETPVYKPLGSVEPIEVENDMDGAGCKAKIAFIRGAIQKYGNVYVFNPEELLSYIKRIIE